MSVVACAPLQHCKVVHFLRHAEAESNAAAHKFPRGSEGYNAAYADSAYFDSILSSKGKAQCAELRSRLATAEGGISYEAVLVSPLRRTLQTATEVFENKGIPWLAVEVAREYSQGNSWPCDFRRLKEQQQEEFSFVSFDLVPSGEDRFASVIESEEDVDRRCLALLELIRARSEKSLVVVSHTGFMTRLFSRHLRWPGSAAFANCELRSVVLTFSQD